MRRMLLLIPAVVLLVAAEEVKDAAKKELESFTGSWQATSIEHDGKEAPTEAVKDVKLVVKGEHYTLYTAKDTIKGTHKLDPTKKPKQIDAVRTEGPQVGETLKGIYTLDSDTFKVCFAPPGKDRPTEFSTKAGGGLRLLVLKRGKP